MGSGKSLVGISLSKQLGYKLIDLDKYIESKHQLTISDIFKFGGEESFRSMETEALIEILENIDKDRDIIFCSNFISDFWHTVK